MLNGNGNGDSSCRSNGDSNGMGTAALLPGMDGILEVFDDSPNVGVNGVNGNGAGVSSTRAEGEKVEPIDRILGCEEAEGIYEDHSTLTVSFSIHDSEKEEMGML
jgi:hypothetical protein